MSAPGSIAVVASYFDDGVAPPVAQTFTPGKGWERCARPQPVTRPYAAALKAQSITSVALEHDGRTVDFLLDELLRVEDRPLLPGELIGSARQIARRHHELRRGVRDGGRG
jgi:hypothetical protein